MASGPADPVTLEAIEKATQRAEEAAARAQKAAAPPRYWLLVGLIFAFVGAVLSFALKESDPSVLGVRLEPFGGVLFALGVLLMVGAAIGSIGRGGRTGTGGAVSAGGTVSADCNDASSIKSIGGLIAVVTGVAAVTGLAVVTLTQLENKSSMVAVTSSAFGIISAVVGAYLGIKITADTSSKASDEAKNAAVAEHVAAVANSKYEGAAAEAEKNLSPPEAQKIKTAGIEAAAEAARTTDPPSGGGET